MQLRDGKSTTYPRAAVAALAIFVLAAFAFWAGCGSSSTSTPIPLSHTTRYVVVSDYYNARVLIYDSHSARARAPAWCWGKTCSPRVLGV